MLGWVRRTWQKAIQGLVHEGRLQQEADVFRLYLCSQYYESGDSEAEYGEGGKIPPYEQQKEFVHRSTEKQVLNLFRNIHEHFGGYKNGASARDNGLPFSVIERQSSVPNAGQGVFLEGYARPGSVVAFYPGLVYTPLTLRHMPNYPHVDKDNPYLVVRWDNCVIDPQGYDSRIAPGGPSSVLGRINWDPKRGSKVRDDSCRHPFANAHLVNHPPAGTTPNVASWPFDFPLSFPEELRGYIPNKYARPPGLLYGGDVLARGLVLVATTHIKDEELFLNYRFNPNRPLPAWYTPVDSEEDSRRWAQ